MCLSISFNSICFILFLGVNNWLLDNVFLILNYRKLNILFFINLNSSN